jgi:hypothetical protein
VPRVITLDTFVWTLTEIIKTSTSIFRRLEMGVPHLRWLLEPCATRQELRHCDVVIDGPSLGYHIYKTCWARGKNSSPFDQPSTELLGQKCREWLDKLESYGVFVYAVRPETLLFVALADIVRVEGELSTSMVFYQRRRGQRGSGEW